MGNRGDGMRSAARLAATAALLAVLTALCRIAPVNATTAGFAFLLAVLCIASVFGLREAVAASIGGMLLFNFYFLPPFGTLTIADPQNWVALFAFLVAAIVASQLSARARRQTEAALRRQNELERLYALGRAILLDSGEGPLPRRLAQSVADSFAVPAVSLYDVATGCEYQGGPDDLGIPPAVLNAALSGDIGSRTDALDSRFSLIRLGNKPAGVLALRGAVSDAAVDAISNLVAIGLERARAREAENRAQAARESEELKSTLLDAIAHEFKTPLTAIKAAVTTVGGDPTIPASHREMLEIVEEESDRLNGLVSDAIETSRIEGGGFHLDRAETRAAELLSGVVRQMGSRLRGRDVVILPIPAGDTVVVDQDLVQLALRQLLDNAVKYSPATRPIRLGGERRANDFVFWVDDEGPGIRAADADRVFDRFYRGSPKRHGIPGSGLGLAVVRRIAEAHGGRASLVRKPEAGARFELTVPL